MVNKCTKNYFFFYLRLKTLTRHPLSGNEMIEYCYCKTRPLKILTVCSRDAPEQDTSLTEAPFFNTAGMLGCFCLLWHSAAFTPPEHRVWLSKDSGISKRVQLLACGAQRCYCMSALCRSFTAVLGLLLSWLKPLLPNVFLKAQRSFVIFECRCCLQSSRHPSRPGPGV